VAFAANASEPDAAALLQRLARPAPDVTSFVEVRYSALLTTALVVSGELEHGADGSLVRRVLEPYRETTTLRGEQVLIEREGSKSRRLSLDRAPELRGMLASFGALLRGDLAMLDRYFTVTTFGSDMHWRIELSPKGAKLGARLSAIHLDGTLDRPRCMTMVEPDGDATVMALGVPDRSTLPSPLEREPLQAWCARGPER